MVQYLHMIRIIYSNNTAVLFQAHIYLLSTVHIVV